MAKSFPYGGYIGQLLRVNLSNKGIVKEDLSQCEKRFFTDEIKIFPKPLGV